MITTYCCFFYSYQSKELDFERIIWHFVRHKFAVTLSSLTAIHFSFLKHKLLRILEQQFQIISEQMYQFSLSPPNGPCWSKLALLSYISRERGQQNLHNLQSQKRIIFQEVGWLEQRLKFANHKIHFQVLLSLLSKQLFPQLLEHYIFHLKPFIRQSVIAQKGILLDLKV